MRCGFIGHRDIIGIDSLVCSEVAKLLKKGVTEFYSGGMGNFDKICEKAVKILDGKLTFVPYNTKQVKEIHELWYDNIICPFGEKEYSDFDIPKRNRWLVDNCDIFLCCVYKDGGAKKTLDYAIKSKKHIINLLDKLNLK